MTNISILSYDIDENILYDENDNILFNMFDFITPNELFLFKKDKCRMTIIRNSGNIIELMYRG